MPEVTLVEAINLALARALTDDPNVVVFGEDVGVNGGVFRATVGLQQRFGIDRVFDTPLSEALIAGLCVGMAAQGLRPVAEIQFMGFLYPCIDQLVNHASRLHMAQASALLSTTLKRPKPCWLISLACAS
jgi:2-oxoisovalerate dehydrogenase E1 component beta subunit